MWQDWKFIVIVALLVVAIAAGGTLGGIALARSNNNSPDRAQTITEIIQNAANSFQDKMNNGKDGPGQNNTSEALDSFLKKLVDEGKITQEQADQFKAWLKEMPDMPMMNGQTGQPGMGFFGMMHNGKMGPMFRFGGGTDK